MTDKVKILVVDDLPEKLLVYQSILEDAGQDLVLARSSTEALKHLLQDDFAVILLDVNMPEMDGFETAATIRTRKRCAHTPIIFITAYVDDLYEMKGYAHGAVDYILAPVNPDVLRTKVRVFVELFRQQKAVSGQLSAVSHQYSELRTQHTELLQVLETATDFVGRADGQGNLVWINPAGRRMLNLNGTEPGPVLFTEGALDVARRDGVWFGETTLPAPPGDPRASPLPMSQVILAHKNSHGTVESFSIISRDISERKRVEAELDRHRQQLEDLVRQRTVELEASYERLRLTDRLASIGTLAAGLGHDMGNLLLPVRMRLDALETAVGGWADGNRSDAAPGVANGEQFLADIAAIRTACEYLNRLSKGLRLFALDPEQSGSSEQTDLNKWWAEVESFLRNSLPKTVTLETNLGNESNVLPRLAMPPHTFTQIVYNLVQNAGDALRDRETGRVVVSAAISAHDRTQIIVCVNDDGPGMDEQVKLRCLEPFFTTKPRRISTGLGLALVHGAVSHAGGTVEIESELNCGTTFRITLPAAPQPAQRTPADTDAAVACVNLRDPRIRAYVTSLLRGFGFCVNGEPWMQGASARLLIIDSPNGKWPDIKKFLNGDDNRRAIIFGETPETGGLAKVSCLEASSTPSQIRTVLREAVSV